MHIADKAAPLLSWEHYGFAESHAPAGETGGEMLLGVFLVRLSVQVSPASGEPLVAP